MKKVVLFVLLLSLIFSIAAFAAPAETVSAQAEDIHIVYVSPLLSHPIWLIAKEGFDQAVADLGIRGDWVGPQNISPEEMAKLIETSVAQKVDGIITQGLVPAEPVNMAIEAGIPVLVVDSDITEAEGKLAYIGKDIPTQAELMYAHVEKTLDKNTKIYASMQVAALNYEVGNDQITITEEVFSKWPGGFELVSVTESKSEKLQATTQWQNTFQTYPEINLAISFGAEGAPACGNVVKEMGLQDKIIVLGVDDEAETLDLIREGVVSGTSVVSFYNYGYQAAYWLYQNITEGLTPEKVVNPATLVIVDKDNIDTYGELMKDFEPLK
jgi:ribose transport system substrate-binding protein